MPRRRSRSSTSANRYYAGRGDLVLVCIDTERLKSELRWETAASIGQDFPHIYGPLNLDAVTQALEFKPGADGTFEALPEGIELQRYGDSLWLRAVNHDGSPHWAHPALREQVGDGLIVTRTGFGTIVAREKGAFTSNWFTRGHYWPDRWFNVIRLQNPDGRLDGYYCNIAQAHRVRRRHRALRRHAARRPRLRQRRRVPELAAAR